MNRSLAFPLCLILAAAVAGCEQHPKLEFANVKGSVTFNGKPVEKGTVTFMAPDKPALVAEIVDGKYAGTAAVGSNTVAISAKRKSGHASKLPPAAEAQIKGYKEWMRGKSSGTMEDFDPTLVETIPPEWSTKSKQTRVVESGHTNEFDFNIK